MTESTAPALHAWEAYYVIVGSSAGALTGLQFVVMALLADAGIIRGRRDSVAAFGSPNVVHFCAALYVSAVLSAPWRGVFGPGLAVALCGVGGVGYAIAILRRTRRQREYTPVFEDWLWHVILPKIAYAAIFVSGIFLAMGAIDAEYAVGGAALLLMFVGIHNAWDTVTFVTVEGGGELRRDPAPPTPPPPAPASVPAILPED